MALLERLQREFSSRALAVIGVHARESKDVVGRYARELGLTFPLVFDPDGKINALFGVVGLPTTSGGHEPRRFWILFRPERNRSSAWGKPSGVSGLPRPRWPLRGGLIRVRHLARTVTAEMVSGRTAE
jgi:peroxiredoxin